MHEAEAKYSCYSSNGFTVLRYQFTKIEFVNLTEVDLGLLRLKFQIRKSSNCLLWDQPYLLLDMFSKKSEMSDTLMQD